MYKNICFWMYKRILKQYNFLRIFLHTHSNVSIAVKSKWVLNEIIIMIMVLVTFISFKKQWYPYKVTKKNIFFFYNIFQTEDDEKQQLSFKKMVNVYDYVCLLSFDCPLLIRRNWIICGFLFIYFQDSNQLQYKSF